MDRTNMFFLVVAAGFGIWIFSEYRKQTQDKRAMDESRRRYEIMLQATQPGARPIDYAEQIATGYI